MAEIQQVSSDQGSRTEPEATRKFPYVCRWLFADFSGGASARLLMTQSGRPIPKLSVRQDARRRKRQCDLGADIKFGANVHGAVMQVYQGIDQR